MFEDPGAIFTVLEGKSVNQKFCSYYNNFLLLPNKSHRRRHLIHLLSLSEYGLLFLFRVISGLLGVGWAVLIWNFACERGCIPNDSGGLHKCFSCVWITWGLVPKGCLLHWHFTAWHLTSSPTEEE